MSRNLQAAITSASNLPDVRFRLLVEVYSVTGGVTRAVNGYNFVSFAGNTYSPVGTFGGIDPIQEDTDVFPRAARLWFSAVNTAQIQDVLSESLFNCPVRILRAFLTSSYTMVASAEQLFGGFINTCEMKLKDPKRGDHFSIEVESRLARPPRVQYFNNETLQYVLGQPGDSFFDYIDQIPFVKVQWGVVRTGFNNQGRGLQYWTRVPG